MSVGIRAKFKLITKGLILLHNDMNGGSAYVGIAMQKLVWFQWKILEHEQ